MGYVQSSVMRGDAMQDNRVRVDVRDDSIIVTIPGSSFRTAFFKAQNEPGIYQSSLIHIDKEWPLSRDEFEKLAWEAANEEARKLGWIE
jgi:hypothetical protein